VTTGKIQIFTQVIVQLFEKIILKMANQQDDIPVLLLQGNLEMETLLAKGRKMNAQKRNAKTRKRSESATKHREQPPVTE